jgi:hypothetical protein
VVQVVAEVMVLLEQQIQAVVVVPVTLLEEFHKQVKLAVKELLL